MFSRKTTENPRCNWQTFSGKLNYWLNFSKIENHEYVPCVPNQCKILFWGPELDLLTWG